MRVFLGGTCNNSTWRENIIPHLECDYFNPVVSAWTEECMAREIKERATCDIVLYVLTPEMTGTYSIAEVTDDSNKRPERVVLVCLREYDGAAFDAFQFKSLQQVARLVEGNGGKVFTSLLEATAYINRAAAEFKLAAEQDVLLEKLVEAVELADALTAENANIKLVVKQFEIAILGKAGPNGTVSLEDLIGMIAVMKDLIQMASTRAEAIHKAHIKEMSKTH